jgi:hypothetical protein
VHLVLSSRIDDGVERTAATFFAQAASRRSKTIGGAPTWSRATDKAWLEDVRSSWSQLANRALEQAGHQQRVDHRSYARQGIDRPPTQHRGWAKGDRRERVDRQNAVALHVRRDLVAVRKRLAEAKRELAHEREREQRAAQAAVIERQWTEQRELEYRLERRRRDAQASSIQQLRTAADLAQRAFLDHERAAGVRAKERAEQMARSDAYEALRQARQQLSAAQHQDEQLKGRWLVGAQTKARAAEQLERARLRVQRLETVLAVGLAALPETVAGEYRRRADAEVEQSVGASLASSRQERDTARQELAAAEAMAQASAARLEALEAARKAAMAIDQRHGLQPLQARQERQELAAAEAMEQASAARLEALEASRRAAMAIDQRHGLQPLQARQERQEQAASPAQVASQLERRDEQSQRRRRGRGAVR